MYSGVIKKKETIIYIQTVISVISNVILGGITGAIINAISCIRNILCYKNKLKNKEKTIIIIISIVFSLLFNDLGFIGILPLISTVTYTLLMDIKGVIKFKKLVIFTMIICFIYDVHIKSYSSAIFDFMNIITNAFSIYKLQYCKIKEK